MKRDLFRRYVWLVDTIRHARKITFERIDNLWMHSPLNVDHSPLALRTFHNHREAIEHLFGIRILCDRSDHNQYYVADDDNIDSTRLKVWMLQTLSLSNVIEKADNVENRIVLDITPGEKFGLTTVIEAMKQNKVVQISYSILTSENSTTISVCPYCVRYWKSTWYIIAKALDSDRMLAFDLARVLSITITDKSFVYPADFSSAEFLRKFYGMDIDSTLPVETIQIKVFGSTRDKVRTLPFHVSQKEILSDRYFSIFEYRLVPSPDFIQAVLANGTDMEVLCPGSLRETIREKINQMGRFYAEPAAQLQSVGISAHALNEPL